MFAPEERISRRIAMMCVMLIYESVANLESRKDAKRDPYVAA